MKPRWTAFAAIGCCMAQACVRLHAPAELALGERPIPCRVEATAATVASDDAQDDWVRVRRVPDARTVKGICVLLPGILGSHSSPTCENRLCDDGWNVIVISPPLVSSVLAEFKVDSEAGRRDMGARVARAVDSVIERAADAGRRMVDELRAHDATLAEQPVILVGESLGALMGVGVAGSGRVPCDAAVFVAGGGSLLDVAAGSTLRRVLFGDLPIDDAEFREGFASASRLDSLAAATALRGCPVVCVTAAIDVIVPIATQEALWVALGEPPRYRFDGGHLELFVFARWNILPVVRAVADRAVADRAGADRASGSVPSDS